MTKEELKTATGQELIDARNYCGVDGYYGDYLDNVNEEMLNRFNRLSELEAQIEKMKCCAKCAHCNTYVTSCVPQKRFVRLEDVCEDFELKEIKEND